MCKDLGESFFPEHRLWSHPRSRICITAGRMGNTAEILIKKIKPCIINRYYILPYIYYLWRSALITMSRASTCLLIVKLLLNMENRGPGNSDDKKGAQFSHTISGMNRRPHFHTIPLSLITQSLASVPVRLESSFAWWPRDTKRERAWPEGLYYKCYYGCTWWWKQAPTMWDLHADLWNHNQAPLWRQN